VPRNEALLPFDLSEAFENALQSLYEHHSKPSDFVPQELFRGIADTLNMSISTEFQSEYPQLCDLIRSNNEVFAAFKVHDESRRMAELLTDDKGELLSFDEWRKLAEPIGNHHNKVWLRTEYDTAVKRAEQARQWKQFEEEKDVLPNLRWVPSTAVTPGADHMVFWNTVRPIDDAFWSRHKPGDRWGCQCSLEATDEAASSIPESGPEDEPSRGLKGNPAKTGELFSKDHPYYPNSCASCPFSTGNHSSAPANKTNKGCRTCSGITGITSRKTVGDMISMLKESKGVDYTKLLREIIDSNEFKPVEGHPGIYAMPSNERKTLLVSAQRAVSFGNTVYILPNPKGITSMDFIFAKNSSIRGYENKNISGLNSVSNRLADSSRQSRRVLLVMNVDYNPRILIQDIKNHFETRKNMVEVLIYKGRKQITIERKYFNTKDYIKRFLREWAK